MEAERIEPPVAFRRPPYKAAWPWVLCVVGLDYLSSLAYQPSVAFGAARILAPLATVGIVLVTLFLAVPLYMYLAGRNPHGSGSTGLLERLIPGWFGKLLVLVLLGFAATDLIFTRTFSAADAAEHLTRCPFDPWRQTLDETCVQCQKLAGELPPEFSDRAHGLGTRQMVVTLLLLIVGSAVAWLFRNGITRWLVRIAVISLGLFLLLASTVIASGVVYLIDHPELVEKWWHTVQTEGYAPVGDNPSWDSWLPLALACIVLFPKLALGLSGYELALTAMPLVKGTPGEPVSNPRGRIFQTRILLLVAALMMAVFLLSSTLVITILVPSESLMEGGIAENRALAYLAHASPISDGNTASVLNPLFGPWFGFAYDVATVVVLTLAGVTVMIGMRDLIPPYLYRLGMDWKWSQRVGLLMYLFTFLKLAITYVFHADPDMQRGAYQTGVLSVFTAAAFTALVDVWQRRKRWILFRISPLFLLAFLVFAASTGVIVWSSPSGFVIAVLFVVVTILVSIVTRFFRTHELRFRGFEFADEESRHLWQDLIEKDYQVLVPVRPNGPSYAAKEEEMRKYHRLPSSMAVVFLKAEIGDASDFLQLPLLKVEREDGRVVVHLSRCTSIPHVIAAAALQIAKQGIVPEIHFGWSGEHPLTANLNFVLFGMGNVPWMVYELIQASDAPADRKPRVMVG